MTNKEIFQHKRYNTTEGIDKCRRYFEEYDSYHLKKIRPEILNLKTEGEVYIYIDENIIRTNFTKTFSKAELSYLFRCLCGMSPHPSMKIIDIKYKLRDWNFNTVRTADLMKNLW